MVTKTCKREGCDLIFESYPSQNKKYCSPGCRYSDPELRGLLVGNITTRHILTEVDEDEKRALCACCGPTKIRKRVEPNRSQGEGPRWRCCTAERARDWAKKYKLTTDDVLKMLDLQDRRCEICRQDIAETFHVDHSHRSGKVRGLLCSNCNTALGLLGDDIYRLRSAVSYLDDHA